MNSEVLTQNEDAEKTSSDSEINGNKVKSDDNLTMELELDDTKVFEASNEENETNLSSEETKIDAESLETSNKNEDIEMNRKRKASESIEDISMEIANKDVIEQENQDKSAVAKQDEKVEQIVPSGLEVLGKGKRARIPNKRYSDIALSPPSSKVQKINVENGEKSTILERVEFKPSGSNSPIPSSLKRQQKVIIDPSDPKFLKPFKYGWKRELVWRSVQSGEIKTGDIYYYSPQGKKLRSMREVSENLKDKELAITDFTFIKVPLKADADKQIVRDAKVIKPSGSSDSSTTKTKTSVASTSKNETVVEGEVTKNARTNRRSNAKVANVSSSNNENGSEGSSTQTSSSTSKSKNSRNRTEKKGVPKPTTVSENNSEDVQMSTGVKKNARKSVGRSSQKTTANNDTKAQTAPNRRKTIKLDKITNQSNTDSNILMENYLQNLSYGYNTLLYVFQYLKVQDLLRAGCVCTMWRDIANHPTLWTTVRMKNSQVRSFEGLANALRKHGTVCLDLRKMLLTNNDEIWTEFSNNIGKVETLRKIELCRCPASVVEKLCESNPELKVLNAVTIRCEEMNLTALAKLTNLLELRLKSTNGLKLTSDLESFSQIKQLKCLSLTSIKDLHTMNLSIISELTELETLDLGECTNFPANFGKEILSKLVKLEKLRLEKGQGDCHTFELLDSVKDMKQLEQLELVNFDIKSGFDKALGACKNIKKLLIIPTYISQSATTNHMVLGGVLRLQKSLSHFVWGVTLELLRVTELFVDQCEKPEKKNKKLGNGDSIPVLKPVPLITDDNEEDIPPALDPPQVEILALPGLQKLLLQSLPTTRVKILKIPFHATWRQSITDAVN